MLENILQTASFITSMLIMFCCIYNLATVLPMSGARVYFIASVVTVIVVNLIPNVWPGINQVHFLLYGLVLPLVLMRAPMPQRLVGVALCLGLLYVGEFLRLFGGFCGRDSGIGPAQRAKTTIWN